MTIRAAAELNQWLPAGLAGRGGQRIRFVPASDLPAVDYESHIYRRGEVSARENSWHERDWNHVFRTRADAWKNEISLLVVGHALLEKFLHPYKAILTGHGWISRGETCYPHSMNGWPSVCWLAPYWIHQPACRLCR
jgi:hypothetical protein